MNEMKVTTTKNDILRWAIALVLAFLVVAGNAYFSEESFLYRAMGIVVVGGIALGVAAYTSQGVAFIDLLRQARLEMRRVVWPTRQETVQTTLVVLLVVLVMSLLLWGLDSLLGFLVSGLIG